MFTGFSFASVAIVRELFTLSTTILQLCKTCITLGHLGHVWVMHSRCNDLSASARQYWGTLCFGSFGSLFTDNINNLYTVYIDSVTIG